MADDGAGCGCCRNGSGRVRCVERHETLVQMPGAAVGTDGANGNAVSHETASVLPGAPSTLPFVVGAQPRHRVS
ncbi:hypothetical protein RO07_25440 [Pandoraea pulmonicola]|uniref:Uncharacterized protein n=1 Tax=Pandoraea pulmonicola TaxID=93221 RepID=A0ABM6FSH0_PANPU|nr:hypothetical protein RO07_25440 [Pandoraea pulmonicola]